MISLIISVVCKLKCPSNYNFLSIDFVFHNVYVCPIICHSLKRQFWAYHLRFQENLRMSQNILTLHLCGGRCQCKPKSDLSVSFEMLTGCGSSEHSGVNCCAIFICYLGARWQEYSGAKLEKRALQGRVEGGTLLSNISLGQSGPSYKSPMHPSSLPVCTELRINTMNSHV